jgi:hypothetical protein
MAACLFPLAASSAAAQTTLSIGPVVQWFSDGYGRTSYLGIGLGLATRLSGPLDIVVRLQRLSNKSSEYDEPFDAVTTGEAGLQVRARLGRRWDVATGVGFGAAASTPMDGPTRVGTSVSLHGLLRGWASRHLGFYSELHYRDLGGEIRNHAGLALGLGVTLQFSR